ncbi:MAG: indole-3-glycerol phosphate synthase TrpC [Mariniblastus sp.]
MSSILEKIVRHKLVEIEKAKLARPLVEIKAQLSTVAPPLDFLAALTLGNQSNRVSLIAEVKKASPSKGIIRDDFHPVDIAKAYALNGASCISVLTDEHFFQGHLDFLKQIRSDVNIPLLRKDFVLDEYQVFEARSAGADAVLLIAECLDPARMKILHQLINELGMTALVELYDSKNIPAVLACEPQLVGVNNRDLNTFEIDLNHSIRVKSELPDEIAMVSESGIFTNDDVRLMHENQVDAILVGESLMRQTDIGQAVKQLLGER